MSTSPVHSHSVISSNSSEPLPFIRSSEPSGQQARTDTVAQKIFVLKNSKPPKKHLRYEYNKRYYQLHREEKKAQHKAYYQLHREKITAKQRAYNQLHKEEIIAKKKVYNQSHKMERNVKERAYNVCYRLAKKKGAESLEKFKADYRQAKQEGREALEKFKKEYLEHKKLQRALDASLGREEESAASASSITEPLMIASSPVDAALIPKSPELSQVVKQLLPQSGVSRKMDESLEHFFDEKYFKE